MYTTTHTGSRKPFHSRAAIMLLGALLCSSATIVAAARTSQSGEAARIARFAFTGTFRFQLAPETMQPGIPRRVEPRIVVASAPGPDGLNTSYHVPGYAGPKPAPQERPLAPKAIQSDPERTIAEAPSRNVSPTFNQAQSIGKPAVRAATLPTRTAHVTAPAEPITTTSPKPVIADKTASRIVTTPARAPAAKVKVKVASITVKSIKPPRQSRDEAMSGTASLGKADTGNASVSSATSTSAVGTAPAKRLSAVIKNEDRTRPPLSTGNRSSLGNKPTEKPAPVVITRSHADEAATRTPVASINNLPAAAPKTRMPTTNVSNPGVRIATAPLPARQSKFAITKSDVSQSASTLPPLPTLYDRPYAAPKRRARPVKRVARSARQPATDVKKAVPKKTQPSSVFSGQPSWARGAFRQQ